MFFFGSLLSFFHLLFLNHKKCFVFFDQKAPYGGKKYQNRSSIFHVMLYMPILNSNSYSYTYLLSVNQYCIKRCFLLIIHLIMYFSAEKRYFFHDSFGSMLKTLASVVLQLNNNNSCA